MTLRRGQKFTLGSTTYKVAYVNASRAHCVSTAVQTVTIGDRTFEAQSTKAIDISPDSQLDVLKDLGVGR